LKKGVLNLARQNSREDETITGRQAIISREAVIRGWLLGEAFGEAVGPPESEAESFFETRGRGDSTTSASVRSGLGGSTGGMDPVLRTCISCPGGTGLMYIGVLSIFRHRFSSEM